MNKSPYSGITQTKGLMKIEKKNRATYTCKILTNGCKLFIYNAVFSDNINILL